MNSLKKFTRYGRALKKGAVANSMDPEEGSKMLVSTKRWLVGLSVLAAVLVLSGQQALATHTANVSVTILSVRVLGNTDIQGVDKCSDVLVTASVTSVTGEVRTRSTAVLKDRCPVRTIFRNSRLNLTQGATNKITSGNFRFTYSVKDDDSPLFTGETMNSGPSGDNLFPCDNVLRTFDDIAGVGESADIRIQVRCRLIADAAGTSELGLLQSFPTLIQSDQFVQAQVFDTVGRQVLDLTETGKTLESLTADAKARLANGVYLAVLKRIAAGTGQALSQSVQQWAVLH